MRVIDGLIPNCQLGGHELLLGLTERRERSVEDAAGQQGTLDRITGPPGMYHPFDRFEQIGKPYIFLRVRTDAVAKRRFGFGVIGLDQPLVIQLHC